MTAAARQMSERGRGLSLVPPAPTVDKGKLLSIDDVRGLFPKTATGEFTVSRWFVTHSFCPGGKIKIGRRCYWYELEANEWIDAQRTPAN